MSRADRLPALLCFVGLATYGQSAPVGQSTGTPFVQYATTDRLGRRITLYLDHPAASDARLPIAVFIQGSGCSSMFSRQGERVLAGYQSILRRAAAGKLVTMVIEKPGVAFGDAPANPGSGTDCTPLFHREHTLERWAEAVRAAVVFAHSLPFVDDRKTLLVGHSEGGIVAGRVSREEPTVTNVASLAGGGPNQLFGLAEIAKRAGNDPDKDVYAAWKDVQRDPDSPAKFFWGHPYKRWSSFLRTSTMEELAASPAKLYVANGVDDLTSTVQEFDVMRADLAARGKDCVFERIAGADHNFNRPGVNPPLGMLELLGRVVAWYLR